MSTDKLSALRAAFAKPERQSNENLPNNYYPFWNMKIGEQCVIRFLPDANPENPLGFLIEKVMHTLIIDGKERSVPCMSMYGEPCDVCKVSQDFYRNNDKINGKKFWKKRQHLAQALVVTDPLEPNKETGENHEGKVRKIALSFQLFNVIKEAFESGDLEEDPSSFKGGYDFVIKKTQQGEYATYAVGSKFKPKQRDLTDEEILSVQEDMVDLTTLLPKNPGGEKIRAQLNAALSGDSVSDDDNEPFVTPAAKAAPATKPGKVVSDDDDPPFDVDDDPVVEQKVTKPTTKPAAVTEEQIDDEADKILAEIRKRRKAS
jgi:hypothetical protein